MSTALLSAHGFPIRLKLHKSLAITEFAVVVLFLLLCIVPITIIILLLDRLRENLGQ